MTIRCLNGHELDYPNQLCNICLERMKMPQASDESRETMRKMFGDPIDDGGPHNFLRDRGYVDHKGIITPPKFGHMVTTEEWACITFLCDEWDYGFEPDWKGK